MIRPYQPTDNEAAVEVWAKASALAHPFLSQAFQERERKLTATVFLPNSETWVWEAEGRVVGFISMHKQEVAGLFVDPEHQRAGIGHALMDHARAIKGHLELEVFTQNPQGRAFYAKYGFEVMHTKIEQDSGFEVLRLQLPAIRPQTVAALLFDMGGVLFEIDFERALLAWQQWSRLSLDELRQRFQMDAAYEQHERGEIDAAAYFAHLRDVLELEATDSEIASGWNAIYLEEITETLNYISAVKDKLPCYAFTNSNPTHQERWAPTYPRVIAAFQNIFVSSELGLRKPDREAFEAISARTGIPLEQMLFFDDTEDNVAGARAAGMPAVHVKSHADVNKALVDLGLL
jgi:putative hydrolase of the HAD superfamily